MASMGSMGSMDPRPRHQHQLPALASPGLVADGAPPARSGAGLVKEKRRFGRCPKENEPRVCRLPRFSSSSFSLLTRPFAEFKGVLHKRRVHQPRLFCRLSAGKRATMAILLQRERLWKWHGRSLHRLPEPSAGSWERESCCPSSAFVWVVNVTQPLLSLGVLTLKETPNCFFANLWDSRMCVQTTALSVLRFACFASWHVFDGTQKGLVSLESLICCQVRKCQTVVPHQPS